MVHIQWVEEDGELLTADGRNLVELPNHEIYRLYGAYLDKHTIRRTKNKYRNLYKEGVVIVAEREQPYDAKQEPLDIANRLSRASKQLGKNAVETTLLTVPTEHLAYYQALQEALESEGRVERAVFSSGEHTGFIKNADNEIEYTDPLKSAKAKFEVTFNTEPKWPVPARVESLKLSRKESLADKPFKTCMVFPDVQIPFADEAALNVALEVLQAVKPDKVVFLGDLLDLSAWSRFIQQPEWATATQDALNQAHQLLAAIRRALPKAEIDVMAGNHEERMPKVLLQNARAAYGLKRADQLDGWPVMSIPYLLALDALDISYHPGYPANRLWLNRNLQIRHGNYTRKKGGGARSSLAAEKVSTITGHDHRLSSHATTVNSYEGGQTLFSYGSGCLCRLDGHVPSHYSGKDLDGAPIEQFEDWQNGFIVATYDEDNFHVEQVPISTFNDYRTMFRGKVYGL